MAGNSFRSMEQDVDTRFAEVYQAIVSRNPEHDFAPSLERVQRVMEFLGDPQKSFRIVTVTGTNGKTSTARMIEALVRAYGLRTGLFTSPHLTNITERITVDGEPITKEKFIEVYDDVAPYIEMVDTESQAAGGPRLSFFEVLTVMAFAAFADAPVDVAVVEVGMGGEWDATNVADADVSVITPIGLDHQEWLGDTIAAIAATKAGIIKPKGVLVRSVQEPLAADILDERAAEVGARVVRENQEAFVVDRQMAVGGQVVTLQTPGAVYADIFLPLHGKHQAHNALLALAAVEQLLGGGAAGAASSGTGAKALASEPVSEGFMSVTSPGRLELLRDSPPILVDVAHNPHGAEALSDAVAETFGFSNLVLVFAAMADKDVEGILAALAENAEAIVLTRNSSPRCADPEDIAPIARQIFGDDNVYVEPKLNEAIAQAVDLAEEADPTGMGTGAGVLITGSVVTVGDAKLLLGRGPSTASASAPPNASERLANLRDSDFRSVLDGESPAVATLDDDYDADGDFDDDPDALLGWDAGFDDENGEE